jgi:hypothetical protein
MADIKKKIKNADFNPVKEDMSGVQAKRVIWSTRALDLAFEGIKQGRKLVANPFYENNTKLLKGDLVFDRTQEEIQEWLRCKNDIIYFVEKYCKLMTPEGIKNVKLRSYQVNYLRHLMDHRLSIYLACRQCGKTTTSAVFMLHYILFNIDKNALVLGNKRKTAVEILDKAKKIYLELPYFLKPGIYKWNEGEIVLDNGCRLMAEATTINSGISFTFHCVLADEFAHCPPNILDKFYNNLFPTITAAKARFMITSTQNGYNLFYRLYKAAEAGVNEYAPFKTDWNEVPEWDPVARKWVERDEAWHQLQVANYGSEEAFNKQFGTDFDVSANILINQRILKKNQQSLVTFVEKYMPGVKHSSFWRWHPNFDPISCMNEYIVCTTDIAEGGGGDYTVCKVHRLIDPGSNKLECVGYFRSNVLNRDEATLSIQMFISLMCNQDRVLLSFERNVYGEIFVNQLIENTMKNAPGCANFDQSCIVKYWNESGTKFTYGIKITSGNKSAHCLLYKEEYEKGLLVNDSAEYMVELNNFSDDGGGKYKAAFGHDDMVMAEVQLTFVRESLQYKLFKDEFETSYHASSTPDTIFNPFEQYDPFNGQLETMYNINSMSYFDAYDPYSMDQKHNISRLNNM